MISDTPAGASSAAGNPLGAIAQDRLDPRAGSAWSRMDPSDTSVEGHELGRRRIRKEATRRRLWISAASVLLVFGIVGSTVGGFLWARYQQTQTARSFHGTASNLASSLQSSVRRDLDFQSVLQNYVATTPGITNHSLAPWLKAIDIEKRYPGTLGFGFDVPVSAANLPAFEATMNADPEVGVSGGPFVVYPSGPRAEYCLARLGFSAPGNLIPAGTDACSPSTSNTGGQSSLAIYKHVTLTGRPAVMTLAAFLTPSDVRAAVKVGISASFLQGLKSLFLIVTPVYAGGATPATSGARERASLGWLVGTFSAKTLVAPILDDAPGTMLQVRAGTGASARVIASGGSVPAGAHLAWTKTVVASPLVSVLVIGSASSAGPVQGIVLGGIGAALSVILFLFLFHLGRSREQAEYLVEKRTAQLQHQALHDSLTGLPNRALLFDRAEQMLVRLQRRPMAVGALYVDLDNFKDVNDSFGHQFGDQLLCAVATRLASALRPSDTVGRLGGDEFLVLVEGEGLEAGPELVAERLLTVLSEPFELESSEPVHLSVAASIGVAVGRRESVDELLRDADVALYEAKAAGKNQYVVFRPEMQTAIADRLDLEMDLRRALGNDELFLVYQPIFDLSSLQPTGVEALVRWRHPTKGVIEPAEFIPVAEDTGLIVPIGRFVLNQACAQTMTWHGLGLPIDMAVNVSVVQLASGTLTDDVRGILERSELDPGSLTLEITETALMRDTELTGRVLRELKSLGVRLSIDDFGTGYSSLAYLRQFPIDTLKIDRTFITKATQTSESGALIRTLIQLGKALGIETLAEGIEEEAQLDRLQREHCDSGQGFLFARPLGPTDIEAFFSKGTARGSEPTVEPMLDPDLARY